MQLGSGLCLVDGVVAIVAVKQQQLQIASLAESAPHMQTLERRTDCVWSQPLPCFLSNFFACSSYPVYRQGSRWVVRKEFEDSLVSFRHLPRRTCWPNVFPHHLEKICEKFIACFLIFLLGRKSSKRTKCGFIRTSRAYKSSRFLYKHTKDTSYHATTKLMVICRICKTSCSTLKPR
jgi:hypothetical protein